MQRIQAGHATARAIWMRMAGVELVRDGNRVEVCACARTNVTPHWCPIDGIPAPHDGIHEVNEASKCCPNHVHACPNIPRLQMPP